MLPTRLTVFLFALSLLVVPAGLFLPPMRWLVLGYDASILLLFSADALLAAKSSTFHIRRERPARLSVGIDNEVALVVENISSRLLTVVVRDEAPQPFPTEPALLRATVPPHGWARLSYRLLPTERGNFAFGNIYVRVRGPLGLAWADRAIAAKEAVQVYPNLLEVRRYEALVRTTLVRAGGYRARRLPGAGREFSHFRDYTVDDDYRHVNWKATARRGKPITEVFESEHSQDIIFCLDIRRIIAARR